MWFSSKHRQTVDTDSSCILMTDRHMPSSCSNLVVSGLLLADQLCHCTNYDQEVVTARCACSRYRSSFVATAAAAAANDDSHAYNNDDDVILLQALCLFCTGHF